MEDYLEEQRWKRENERVQKYKSVSSTHTPQFYAIFRIGRKYTSVGMVAGFQRHMEREMDTPNANTWIENEILIGDENIKANVEEYIKDIKLRKNGIVARELLLTASPNFFRGLNENQLIQWKDTNTKWLKERFGSNCIYAVLHKDESTWHIHALIVPRFYDENKQRLTLANSRYFDGIEKLRNWQDDYAKAMHSVFKGLNRGVKFSKAKHIEIRHYYAMVNAQLNEQDIKQICAKAKNSELLEIKIKSLQNTLNAYKELNNKAVMDIEDMKNTIKDLKKDNKLYKQVVEILSENYGIPQNGIKKSIDMVQKRLEESKGLERGR